MGRYLDVPYVKGSDTSFAAAESMVSKTPPLRTQILDHIRERGEEGITCDQIEADTGLSHQTVSARITELRDRNLIKDSGKRRKTRSGRKASVYIVNGLK